jgi:hypothetical protein
LLIFSKKNFGSNQIARSMDHFKLALGLLLVICATYGAAGSAPRGLLQGRSADAPGRTDEAELPRGRPEDVAAVGE